MTPTVGPEAEHRPWRVRAAEQPDAEAIHGLVRELAAYEREPAAVEASVEDFRAALFAPDPLVHGLVAEVDDPQPVVVGFALWFVSFSTWRGRHGMWLEDLFVRPDYRRLGLGRELLRRLSAICVDRGYPRLEWWVLDWNVDAQAFYRSLGARPMDDWTVWRLDGEPLVRLSGGHGSGD